MGAKEVLSYYGKSGLFEEIKYYVKFILGFYLSIVAFFSPFRQIRSLCHKLRGVKIGEGVYIGHDIIFDRVYPDLISIGDNTSIGDKCIIASHSNIPSNTILKKIYPRKVSPVKIGKGVWIAPGVIILAGVTIGDESVIGAGSVVTSDIPSRSVAVGSTAKVIKKLDENVFSDDK